MGGWAQELHELRLSKMADLGVAGLRGVAVCFEQRLQVLTLSSRP